jgi:hypothetical protein
MAAKKSGAKSRTSAAPTTRRGSGAGRDGAGRSRATPLKSDGGGLVPDLILDQFEAVRVLAADTPAERNALLERVAGKGRVEQDMVEQLSHHQVLVLPHRFEEAHGLLFRSLDVLHRNGTRAPTLPRLGPLVPIARWLVQQVTRWIVRTHERRIIDDVCNLYALREAASDWSTHEHRMLRRCRIDAVRVRDELAGNPLGVPAFLVGGAFLTTIVSTLQSLAGAALSSTLGSAAFAGVLVAFLAALSWVALYSAGVARHRIRLSTDTPVQALWETIGNAGDPPRDRSFDFAVYAIVLLILSWVVIPLGIWLAIRA